MKSTFPLIAWLLLISSTTLAQDTLNITFGSCNKESKPQDYWYQIADTDPDLWIWLGDNVYADTEDMDKMKADYDLQKNAPAYQSFISKVPVDGVWDDHDYGANDAGIEFPKKTESRELMMDFLDIDEPVREEIRQRGGTYHSQRLIKGNVEVHMIFLDTRWFRSPLLKSSDQDRRYEPSDTGTLLGAEQWLWLEKEISNSESDLILIASSIQLLSNEHGWEKWGNFPHERTRMLQLLENKRAIVLSGDRHITEFSFLKNGKYPLYDFTSSGLTHSWRHYSEEANELRVGRLFNVLTFGSLIIWKDPAGLNVQMNMHQMGEEQPIQKLIAFFPTEL